MAKHYAQITLKNGTHIQIGVQRAKDYQDIRNKIINTKKTFVDLIDSCTVKTDEVVLMELLTHTLEEEEKDED